MANALSGSPVSYRRNALGDYRAQGNGRSPMSAVNALQALSMIPGVGDFLGPVADAAMYYDRPESRTKMNFGLSALGMLPLIPSMTAYHGSPYLFDKFDMAKIGTGEGAQAYGHGLYFAENPAVASDYAWNLSQRLPDRIKYKGKAVAANTMLARALEDVGLLGKDAALLKIDDSIKFNEKYAPDMASMYRSIRDVVAEAAPNLVSVNRGYRYTVDLPDEAIDRMLDWDKPLSEQPESIRKAINNLWPKKAYEGWGTGAKEVSVTAPDNLTGAEIYARLSGHGKDAISASSSGAGMVEASNRLKAIGIPGIKYLDQGSRASGNGTRNFVVFDDKLAKILKRE